MPHQKPGASRSGGCPAWQVPPPASQLVSVQQVSRQRPAVQRPERQSASVSQWARAPSDPTPVRPMSAAGRQNDPPPTGGIQQTDEGSGSQSLEVQQGWVQRAGPAPWNDTGSRQKSPPEQSVSAVQ